MPADAVSAATHQDPYPYYARLRAERPFEFDHQLGLWVAASAAVIEEVLTHPQLRVRPPGEPVPRALLGTAAGEVFALLVRFNDGAFHATHRPGLQAATRQWTFADVERATREAVADLAARSDANALLTRIPVQSMARLLGTPAHALDATAQQVDDFVAGIAASANPDLIAKASLAAMQLMSQGEVAGLDRPRSANRIALMQQSLDATAGLIGNCVIHLQRSRGARPQDAEAWKSLVAHVARWDPPVHNTRRFAAGPVDIAGSRVAEGEGILVLLASGNHDPAGRQFGFGTGAHHCPGEAVAMTIAVAALEALATQGALHSHFGSVTGYRPLPNARIPVFQTATTRK